MDLLVSRVSVIDFQPSSSCVQVNFGIDFDVDKLRLGTLGV